MSRTKTNKGSAADGLAQDATNARPEEGKAGATGDGAPVPPREGTKQALVVALLSRPEGATVHDLSAATEWLPHTTRAALTGLRRRGFPIERHSGGDGASVYLIPTAAPEPAAAPKRRSARRRGSGEVETKASA